MRSSSSASRHGPAAAALPSLLALAVATGFVPTPSPHLITHGPRQQKLVALTFDADPHGFDPRIVDELGATSTPATIFLTGLFARRHPGAVRAFARDPRLELENHSYDHRAWESPCYGLPAVDAAGKRSEVTRTQRLLEQLTGRRPHYFRFPGGCQDEADVALVRSLDEQPVQWDVVSGDAYLRSPAAVERQVLADVRPGSIVVMHLNGAPYAPATAAALPAIVARLRERGFRLVLLRSLLVSTGRARGP